jgi:tRNA threonylcarbamoyladenosine modification (KEOPS) complex Cgi121 subunit
MITQLPQYNQTLLIEGLISNDKIEFAELMKRFGEIAPSSTIQIMDGSKILGYDHILFAVLNALEAKQNGRMICDDLSLEILVYASAQRQIKNSVEMLGVKGDVAQLILVAVSKDRAELERLKESIPQILTLNLDSSFLNDWSREKLDRLRRIFGISDAELRSIGLQDSSEREVLEKLVVEMMALLSVSA